jgi:hypothetical protein
MLLSSPTLSTVVALANQQGSSLFVIIELRAFLLQVMSPIITCFAVNLQSSFHSLCQGPYPLDLWIPQVLRTHLKEKRNAARYFLSIKFAIAIESCPCTTKHLYSKQLICKSCRSESCNNRVDGSRLCNSTTNDSFELSNSLESNMVLFWVERLSD